MAFGEGFWPPKSLFQGAEVVLQRQSALALSQLLALPKHRSLALEAGAFRMLGAAVLRHHADPLVALPGVRAMQHLSELREARSCAEEAEVVEALAAAMLSHRREELLQLKACEALTSLCASGSLAERATQAGAVEALVTALAFDSVALKAVQALSLLCAAGMEPRQRAAEAGALELLAARPQLGWWAAGALGVICAGSERHAQRAAAAGALETLVAILQRDQVAVAASALGFLCARSGPRAARAVALGAVEALQQVMAQHREELPLQTAAVGALGVIAVAAEAPGAQRALLTAARQHATLRGWALKALQATERWEEAEELEGIEVCSFALKEHPTDAQVQESQVDFAIRANGADFPSFYIILHHFSLVPGG